MSTTTEASATVTGAASSDSALVSAGPDEQAAGQQPVDVEKVRKAAALMGLDKVAAILKQKREELVTTKTQLADLTVAKADRSWAGSQR